MKNIKINEKEYAVHFGLSSIIHTGRELGYKNINELEKMFNGMAKGELDSLSDAAYLIKAGLDRGCTKANLTNDLSPDDLLDLMLEDVGVWNVLVEELISSFQTGAPPQTETSKKKQSHSLGGGSKKQH